MRANILNASAGSGKTYQLAYKYVHDTIANIKEQPDIHRHILAVTFTNKATEEMKTRILEQIHKLASGIKSDYLQQLTEDVGISEREIRQRAKTIRSKILHDYARFSVLTIDKFFQRILRAFIKELGLDLNYNIELESASVLTKSTDALIEEIRTDKELKKWLTTFVQERIEEGSRWDVREGILGLGEEIFKEENKQTLALSLSRDELSKIVNRITAQAQKTKLEIQQKGQEALAIMDRSGVTCADFKGKSRSFAFYFQRIASGDLSPYTATVAKMSQTSEGWCDKKSDAAPLVAQLQPLLNEICTLYDQNHRSWNTAGFLRENFRSFALLTDLYKKVQLMCEEQNMMLLSETKYILSEFIGHNDVPFIFEKAGNRYDRFMIDEFQDTSLKEWQNFLPLLQNAMAQVEDTSVFIVGDIKQSIYRWRGGDWKLLHRQAQRDLGEDETLVINKKENFRSLAAIVEFNNEAMARVVAADNKILNNILKEALDQGTLPSEDYNELKDTLKHAYANHKQTPRLQGEHSGYVRVETYNDEPPVVERICMLLDKGFRPCDILILVRSKTDGAKIAEDLLAFKRHNTDPKHHFDVMTQEALIIGSAPVSSFIVAAMRLIINPNDKINRAIYNQFLGLPFELALDEQRQAFFASLRLASPEEAFEKIVMHHQLQQDRQQTAYLQAIHEQILTFSNNKIADLPLFLEWWDEQGASRSLSIEESTTTIEITTIHKAKGLEKAAVIIPYCKWQMGPMVSASAQTIVWAKAQGEASQIGRFPVRYKTAMSDSDFSADYYRELVYAHVDNVNLLYVALTRAAQSLHVFVPSKGSSHIGSLLLQHLTDEDPAPQDRDPKKQIDALHPDWSELKQTTSTEGVCFELGAFEAPETRHKKKTDTEHFVLEQYLTSQADLELSLPSQRYFEENNEFTPRDLGIMMHKAFQEAETEEDIQISIQQMQADGILSESDKRQLTQKIEQILRKPHVKEWFSTCWTEIRNENDIILPSVGTRRPDRVMIRDGKVVVVDYKFGDKQLPSHQRQMSQYIDLMKQMGHKNCIGYLWYVKQGEIVKVETK